MFLSFFGKQFLKTLEYIFPKSFPPGASETSCANAEPCARAAGCSGVVAGRVSGVRLACSGGCGDSGPTSALESS